MKNRRIIVTHYGGPDALQLLEEECPEPKRGEVRVRVLAAGVSLPDVMAREGIHPETPSVPFTPGWDLIGTVDRVGQGVTEIVPGQIVAAMPISGAYAEFVCLPQRELIPVPSGLDAAEGVSLILNYITAHQMLHRSAKVRSGQRLLIHGASGGVGTALLQLGRLVGLEMYGTCSSRGAAAVSELGGIPIDYQQQDFVMEMQSLTNPGADVVFDGMGGAHIWRSRKALRRGGKVVALWTYWFATQRTIGVRSVRQSASLSRNCGLRLVHCCQLSSPRSQARRALQHSNSKAAKTDLVPTRFDSAL